MYQSHGLGEPVVKFSGNNQVWLLAHLLLKIKMDKLANM